jgi:signal transduction histidine kinase
MNILEYLSVDHFNFLSISGLVSAVFCFGLTCFIVATQRRLTQIIWGIFIFLISLWSFGLFRAFSVLNPETVLFWSRFLNLSAIFIPTSFLIFTFVYTDTRGVLRRIGQLFCGFSFVYFCVSLLDPYHFIGSVGPTPWFAYYPLAGTHYWVFSVLYFVQVIFGTGILIRYYSKSDRAEKNRTLFLFVGMFVGFMGGATTFPLLYQFPVYPFGVIGVNFYTFLVTYAITKHELLNIKVVISRSGAFIITLCLFGAGYISLLLPYRYFISTETDLLFVLWSILYGGLGVGLYFHRIQKFLQTSAYRKFLNFSYNFEETLKKASSKLVRAQETSNVIDAIFDIQSSLEIGDSYAILKEETGYQWYLLNKLRAEYEGNDEVAKQRMEDEGWMDEIVQAFDGLTDSVSTLGNLPKKAQHILQKKLGLNEKLPYLAIHSFKEIQAVFILGEKLSEEEYTAEELSLFEIMLNQAITVFERITQTQKILDLNTELESTLKETTWLKDQAMRVAKDLSHQSLMNVLMAGVSHEIRNPINEIQLSMHCLAQDLGTGKRQEAESGEKEWVHQIDLEDYSQVFDAQSGEVVGALQEAGYVGPEGHILDKVDMDTLDISQMDLGPDVVDRLAKIKWLFAKHIREKAVFEFVNMATVMFGRILSIVENMMKYGVSSGGVKPETFARIQGLSAEDGRVIFERLVEAGYLDEYGGVLDKYRKREPGSGLPIGDEYASFSWEIERQIKATPGAIKEDVSINEVLLLSIRVLKGNLQKKQIELLLDLDPHLPVILGDKLRLQQAFFNVIYNAVQALEKYDASQKSIVLKTEMDHILNRHKTLVPAVRVSIRDNGPGIPPDVMEKIFYPFFTTKAPTGGENVGLGLSIVHDVIVTHGGVLSLDSKLGEGTVFYLDLPVKL